MPWYKAGTVSVTQNSNAVTGTGTSFIANGRVGDAFRGPDGGWYEITNIASDTAMSISPPYQGVNAAAGVYAIAPMQGYVKQSADALRALVNQFGGVLAVLGTDPTLAGVRAALNLADSGGLAEGSNKYFTDARVRAAVLTGLVTTDVSAVAATDALLVAIGKLQAQSSAKAGKGANSDITSLSALTTALSVLQGGTGVTSMAALRTALGFDDFWTLQPIGIPIAVYDHYSNTAPPTNNPLYRYIKLTASDAYNTGLLTGESVSGSAPLVIATATLSLAGSPINGAFINLINTERRVIRAGASGTADADAMQGHGHRETVGTPGAVADSGATGVGYAAGASSNGFGIRSSTGTTGNDLAIGIPIANGANGSPRVSTETRAKSIGATFYMRVK